MTADPKGGLGRSALFAGVERVEIQALLDVGAKQTFLAGDAIFDEGDPGGALWIVESGTVEVFKTIRGTVSRVLGTEVAGAVLGEMSFLDGSRRSAGARAVETADLLMLTRDAFDRLSREHPRLASRVFEALATVVAGRLREAHEAYRQSVAAAMEATGAAPLNLHRFAEDLRLVTIHLMSGAEVTGNLLALEHQPPGWALLIKDRQDRVSLIPYHAVARIQVG